MLEEMGFGEIGHGIPALREILTFLLASIILVPLFQKLKASPILGFLITGAIIGPSGFAVIADIEGVRTIAEFGVVFLLFTIGLELSVERLRAMRRYVFGLGAAQVFITAIAIAAVAYAWGNAPAAALLIGAGLALSSTAMVMQTLSERGEIASRFGRVSFSVLLFQDLAVAPILILVTAFGSSAEGSNLFADGLWTLGKAALAVVILLFLGRIVLRGLLSIVANVGSTELNAATALFIILGIAAATEMAGLSMALGAFLAGLILAETEFRHQVEADIMPFKGLLLGLFFISVGMALDLSVLLDSLGWLLFSLAGLLALKTAITTGLALAFGLTRPEAVRTGLSLAEAGEFAFVILASALTFKLIPPETGQFMAVLAGLSMALTPLLVPFSAWLVKRYEGAQAARERPAHDDTLRDHVVICGYGRVGQTVADLMRLQTVPYVALDLDPSLIKACRARSEPVFYGDAIRPDVLERFGASRAAAIVITLDAPQAAHKAFEIVRDMWPDVPVFVRAANAEEADRYMKLGARHVVPETLEASLQLSGQVLHALGTPMEAVNTIIERIRQDQYAPIADVIEGKSASEKEN